MYELGGQILPKLDQELAVSVSHRPVRHFESGPSDRLCHAFRGWDEHGRLRNFGRALPTTGRAACAWSLLCLAVGQKREHGGQQDEHGGRRNRADPRHQHEVEEGIGSKEKPSPLIAMGCPGDQASENAGSVFFSRRSALAKARKFPLTPIVALQELKLL
ncbi:hypothetical protein NKY39_06505 [Sinorhizobium meliloti]|uniref:hypothetical protein n=1 Tax=Rhizobium meliloti TaxID=382 RepID=UPI003D65CD1C